MGNHTQNGTTNGTTPLPQPPPEGFDVARLLEVFGDLLVFVAIVAVGLFVGSVARFLYMRFRRGLPTSGQILMGKTFVVVAVAVAFAFALIQIYHVDLFSVFATLGIVSVALGFGLQNTVANLAAGVSLSVDKPFDVGDRIQVGQTWGDVVSVGLRSTRIITTSGQHVIIPNAILDTQEVWNNTLSGSKHLRVEIPIGISYGSSIALAEYLALQAARRDPKVLAYPEPLVQVKDFGESAIDMELRCWLDRAEDRPRIVDRLLREIKVNFDKEGVQFPFPQRTVSYLQDGEPPAETPDFLEGEAARKPTILVCTRGVEGAEAMADRVVRFVDRLGCRLVVLSVLPPQKAMQTRATQAAINHYLREANQDGVPAKGRQEVGDLSEVVTRVAREEGAKLIIFGRSQRIRFGGRWMVREVMDTKRTTDAPVLSLDADQEVDEEFVETWRKRIFGPSEEEEEAARDEDEVEAKDEADPEGEQGSRAGDGDAAAGDDPDAEDEGPPKEP